MKTLYEQVIQSRMAGDVKRYHTQRMLREQNVAAHSWAVAMLVQQMVPDCRKEVILACLEHDLPELSTGDVPAPAKWNSLPLQRVLEECERVSPLMVDRGLTDVETQVVKWADSVELMLWCQEEADMGNSYARNIVCVIWERICRYPVSHHTNMQAFLQGFYDKHRPAPADAKAYSLSIGA